MQISLLGAPGCGKGTQAKLICEKFNIAHISTGDLFRKAIADNTPLGIKIKSYMSKLVPDEIVIDLVKERIKEDDCKNGFVLDGFPRTLNQAELFEKEVSLDVVIYFDIELELAKTRMLERRTCQLCGSIFTVNSVNGDVCPDCGGHVDVREEDKKADERLKTFMDLTYPLVEFYNNNGKLKIIDVNRNKDLPYHEGKSATFNEIKNILEGLK